jgi:hypothetical protein
MTSGPSSACDHCYTDLPIWWNCYALLSTTHAALCDRLLSCLDGSARMADPAACVVGEMRATCSCCTALLVDLNRRHHCLLVSLAMYFLFLVSLSSTCIVLALQAAAAGG